MFLRHILDLVNIQRTPTQRYHLFAVKVYLLTWQQNLGHISILVTSVKCCNQNYIVNYVEKKPIHFGLRKKVYMVDLSEDLSEEQLQHK